MATWLRAMVFLFVSLGTVPISNAQTQPAVEYFHAGWGYYFVTAFPGEIANLDGDHGITATFRAVVHAPEL